VVLSKCLAAVECVVCCCRSDNSTANSCSADQDKIILPLDENERVLGLQMALKCADVGHVTAALPVHIRWVCLPHNRAVLLTDLQLCCAHGAAPFGYDFTTFGVGA